MNPVSVEEMFDTLCFLLDDTLERQENILEICRAQGAAARTHDIEYLEAKSAALVVTMREAILAEQNRLELIQEIGRRLECTETPRNMTALIALAPEPYAGRIAYYQSRLKEVLDETNDVVRSNAHVMRTMMRVVKTSLTLLEQCATGVQGYDAAGMESGNRTAQPRIIDQKG